MAKTARTPALLYREPDMAVRVIREEFNRNYRGVVIDDRDLYEEVRDYVASISPELADRVEWAGDSDDPLPVFERYHVHEQIHKALDRKVWLPSGGSLIIERTEALTVIDVNTGKNVGTSNLEETVFRNNLEAAEEIARQLRLRDIGGIIVIDFIDMEIAANRAEVIKTFRAALARDKTRTQVFDISELGLVEMTRKRISEGLVESLLRDLPHLRRAGDHLRRVVCAVPPLWCARWARPAGGRAPRHADPHGPASGIRSRPTRSGGGRSAPLMPIFTIVPFHSISLSRAPGARCRRGLRFRSGILFPLCMR